MRRWDIFCKVVDNFGDVGVCWRLARQLADEHGADVRLWIDRLPSFARLCPTASPDAEAQRIEGIEICRWPVEFPNVEAADVVIEAFACQLPENYIAAMSRRGEAPAWINLEYLSAESWVEGCHRLPSPQMNNSLAKYFFFPGFTRRTGGLLRERGLSAARDAFGETAEGDFWRSLGAPARREGELRVLLFCYENAALPELLRRWAEGPETVTVFVTPGAAADQTADWFGEPFSAGSILRKSMLSAFSLPYLPQPIFDRLLWACDVNFVRGEDSFVRAQWADRPFVWQPYPQSEETHLVKLDAFLSRYLESCEPAEAVRQCWNAWNGRGGIATAWTDFIANRAAIERHCKDWANLLDQTGDLVHNLVSFVLEIEDL